MEKFVDLRLQRREIRSRSTWAGAKNHIAALRKGLLITPGQNPETAFHFISRHGVPHSCGNRQAQSGRRSGSNRSFTVLKGFRGTTVRSALMWQSIMRHNVSAGNSVPQAQNTYEFRMILKSFHLKTGGIRQTETCGPWRDGG